MSDVDSVARSVRPFANTIASAVYCECLALADQLELDLGLVGELLLETSELALRVGAHVGDELVVPGLHLKLHLRPPALGDSVCRGYRTVTGVERLQVSRQEMRQPPRETKSECPARFVQVTPVVADRHVNAPCRQVLP